MKRHKSAKELAHLRNLAKVRRRIGELLAARMQPKIEAIKEDIGGKLMYRLTKPYTYVSLFPGQRPSNEFMLFYENMVRQVCGQ